MVTACGGSAHAKDICEKSTTNWKRLETFGTKDEARSFALRYAADDTRQFIDSYISDKIVIAIVSC